MFPTFREFSKPGIRAPAEERYRTPFRQPDVRNGDKFNFAGYPPDKHEKATQPAREQAQLLALDWAA
jgi:hypothetical protein